MRLRAWASTLRVEPRIKSALPMSSIWTGPDGTDPDEVLVVMEPTRNAWVSLAAWFRRHRANVVLVRPSEPDVPIRPVIRDYQRESGHAVPLSVAFRPPALASRVILRPLRTPAFLTVGPPTTTNIASDPIGIATFHTCKMRPDWVPSRPRDGGAHPAGSLSPPPAPAASQRPVLLDPLQQPIGGSRR
jgi:hypothetical protein